MMDTYILACFGFTFYSEQSFIFQYALALAETAGFEAVGTNAVGEVGDKGVIRLAGTV